MSDDEKKSEKKSEKDSKRSQGSEYIAFFPIGVTFITLSLALDNMWAFLPVGIVFFTLGLCGLSFSAKNKPKKDGGEER